MKKNFDQILTRPHQKKTMLSFNGESLLPICIRLLNKKKSVMTTGGTKVFSTKVDGSKVIKPFILPK